MENEENNLEAKEAPTSRAKWIKRLGLLGFLFFLVKGLLWLSLPVLLVWFGTMRP